MAAVRNGSPKDVNCRPRRPHVCEGHVPKPAALDLSLRAFLPTGAGSIRQAAVAIGGCSQPAGVHGRDSGASRTAGNLPARRPYSRSAQYSVGQSLQRGRHLQDRGRTEGVYGGEGIDGSKPVIAYCRIGERSSHTWFVLKYLLGYDNVINYDGSWTEWGNLVGVPVEKGQAASASAK